MAFHLHFFSLFVPQCIPTTSTGRTLRGRIRTTSNKLPPRVPVFVLRQPFASLIHPTRSTLHTVTISQSLCSRDRRFILGSMPSLLLTAPRNLASPRSHRHRFPVLVVCMFNLLVLALCQAALCRVISPCSHPRPDIRMSPNRG